MAWLWFAYFFFTIEKKMKKGCDTCMDGFLCGAGGYGIVKIDDNQVCHLHGTKKPVV